MYRSCLPEGTRAVPSQLVSWPAFLLQPWLCLLGFMACFVSACTFSPSRAQDMHAHLLLSGTWHIV